MGDERIDRRDELAPLTDSLVSCIRWRLSDYEAIVRCEMNLLLERRSAPASPGAARAAPRRPRP
ncbi:MAG TPA: hypothetical protein VF322_08445 [Gammaproteobacteria bacterium]